MPTITKKSRAKIRTSLGDMEVEFLADKAPKTVDNFLTLVNKGFYEGLTFHRVMKDFIVQGGCPKGDGSGGPGYTIRPEFNDTPHVQGIVSMARSADPHSAGSQFFICLGESRYLDSRYTAFARVVDGLDVLEKMGQVSVNMELRFKEASAPRDPIYINGIDLTDVTFDERVEKPRAQHQPQAEPRTAEPETTGQESPTEARDDAAEGGGGDGEQKAGRSRSSRKKTSRRNSGSGDKPRRASKEDGGKDDSKAGARDESKAGAKGDRKAGDKEESKAESKAGPKSKAGSKRSGDDGAPSKDAASASDEAAPAKKTTRARSTKKTATRAKSGGSTRGRKAKGAGKDDEE